MEESSILSTVDEHIAVLTINRPEHLNVLTSDTARTLNGALLDADTDDEVRVIVIRGAGPAFCTGIDVSEFFGKTHARYLEWVSRLMDDLILVMGRMKKPVIASVHGHAVAYGTGLVSACDLAVAAEGTRFGVNAVNVGLFCMGPAVPLSRSVGRKRALELLLTGDLIDAHTAAQWGLINTVVPPDRLEEATMKLARNLAGKSPLAVQMGKRAFYGMADLEYEKAMAFSNEVFAGLCVTRDAHEGVEAFVKKRTPEWTLA